MMLSVPKIWQITRAKDWRLSLVPFVIGCIYLWIGWFDIQLSGQSLLLFTLSFVTTMGFAALGYFINEFFDIATDAKAGKSNTLSQLPGLYQASLFVFCMALALLPWLFLPFDKLSLLLIGIEISLFLLYSLPFPRFKNIPLLSSVIDSGYAYLVPQVLTFYTYSLFGGKYEPQIIFLLAPAVFVIGLRNITIHHVNDVFKDQRSKIITLPQSLGVKNTSYVLIGLMTAEIFLIMFWSVIMAAHQAIFWLWLVVYISAIIYRLRVLLTTSNLQYFTIEPIRHLTDPIYQYVFPAFTLGYILMVDYRWSVLVPFHVFFLLPMPFLIKARDFFSSATVSLYYVFKRTIRQYIIVPVGAAVNYGIYYLFLLFGVDLRKENISAMSYLKRKFQRG
ncbi:MAG: UbiA family prenyltransferase [Chitinophagales bacterium]